MSAYEPLPAPLQPVPSRPSGRPRAMDVGIDIGVLDRGPLNAITDVEGVEVGHCTLIDGHGRFRAGRGPVRTGVTAIVPGDRDVFHQRVLGGSFVLNGAGEVSGLTQINEWGLIETPILLTNTLSVGTVGQGCVRWMVERHPGIGREHDVIIPVVGECDDSWLNDVAGRHVRHEHVFEAIEEATSGPVVEGNVGGGTGMVAFDLKGGIGTASRKLPPHKGAYTVGVLVMANFGLLGDLRIDGLPIGAHLAAEAAPHTGRRPVYGSIIAVVATDAPLWTHQLHRLAKRAGLGIGRTGSIAAHGSGEIVVAFSVANKVPRGARQRRFELDVLNDHHIDPLYRAAIEATEEAIINALFAADTLDGRNGRVAPALPIERVRAILERYPRPPHPTRVDRELRGGDNVGPAAQVHHAALGVAGGAEGSGQGGAGTST